MTDAIIYAAYEDDGSKGPGAQGSNTFPTKALLVFANMKLAHQAIRDLEKVSGRKNPRITAFYSQDKLEQLSGCYPVIFKPPLEAKECP